MSTEAGKVQAQREAYGLTLAKLGEEQPEVVVLDADVSKSTRTTYFAEKFPERFFNFGIAEQNMMAAAAGMAACGLIPFVNTFSFLATFRAADQFWTSVVYPGLNVKVAASYGGVSDSYDGPTHQSITDIAWVRSLPNLVVVVPADAVEVEKALPVLARYPGPVWLRLARVATPIINGDEFQFHLGRAVVYREGRDVALIGCGVILYRVLEAARLLEDEGIRATVLSISTLKPLDKMAIIDAARQTGAIVTCEEHNVLGGLGAAVCETVCDVYPVPVTRLGFCDTFAESGGYDELLDKYGLSIEMIAETAKKMVQIKLKQGG